MGVDCFEIRGRYLDFDGEMFSEANEKLQIEKFPGLQQVENLAAHPLEYFSNPKYAAWRTLVIWLGSL